ncbi:MAG: tetratricopeptide repeat protein [Ignavibacteriales bacterium]
MKRLAVLSFLLALVPAIYINAQKMDFKVKMLMDPAVTYDQLLKSIGKKELQVTSSSIEAKELYLEAQKLIDELKLEEAIPVLGKAISLDENFALAHLLLAKVLREIGDPDKAKLHQQKAMELADNVSEGESLWIRYQNAYIFGPMQDYIQLRNKLDSTFPNDRRIQYEIGSSYYFDGEMSKAVEYLEKSVRLDPGFAPAFNVLGYAYFKQKKDQEAEKALKRYIELQPNSPNPYDSYAELLLSQGKYDESIAQYQKALSIDPAFYSSLIGVGNNYIFMGEYDKARECYMKLFSNSKRRSDKYDALYNEAISYLYEGNTENALKAMDRYIRLAISDSNYFEASTAASRISFILSETGKTDEALKQNNVANDFLNNYQVPEADKRLRNEWLNLDKSYIMVKKGNLKEARMQLEISEKTMADEKGGDIDKYFNTVMGMLCLNEGNYDGALKYLSGGFTTAPENLYYTAQAYQKKGDNEKARACLDKILNSNENSVGLAIMRPRVKEMLSAR